MYHIYYQKFKKLSLYKQKQILSKLEENIMLGSQVTEITKEVKEMRFSKGKVCPHCNCEDISRMVSIMISKDIFVKIVGKHLPILLTLQHIKVRNL